jgi:hypothetical protein
MALPALIPDARNRQRPRFWSVLLSGVLLVGSCKEITSSDVARWQVVGDVASLVQALGHDRTKPWTAADASLALITIRGAPPLLNELRGLPQQRRSLILAYLLFSVLPAKLRDLPTVEAIAVRDTLMDLRPLATDGNRAQLDRLLVDLVVAERKAPGPPPVPGRYPVSEVARAAGEPALAALLALLDSAPPVLDRVAALLPELTHRSNRPRIGQALVQRAAIMASNPATVWQALGRIGGPAPVSFLRRIVERGAEPDAPFAARCLRLGPADPDLVPFALRLVGDRQTGEPLREELFALLAHIATPEARTGVLRMAERARTPTFRRRALAAEAMTTSSRPERNTPAPAEQLLSSQAPH